MLTQRWGSWKTLHLLNISMFYQQSDMTFNIMSLRHNIRYLLHRNSYVNHIFKSFLSRFSYFKLFLLFCAGDHLPHRSPDHNPASQMVQVKNVPVTNTRSNVVDRIWSRRRHKHTRVNNTRKKKRRKDSTPSSQKVSSH